MLYVKVHSSYRRVVALCDTELIGKKLEEGKRQLEIKEQFFKGREIDEQEAITLLQKEIREDATFNIVGERSIKAAEDAGIIEEENVSHIQEIPFTLILL